MSNQHSENTSLTVLILGGIAIGVVVTTFLKSPRSAKQPAPLDVPKNTAVVSAVNGQPTQSSTSDDGTENESNAQAPVPDDPLGIADWAEGIERSIDAIDLKRQIDRLENDILPAIDRYENDLSLDSHVLDPSEWRQRMEVIERVRNRFLDKLKL